MLAVGLGAACPGPGAGDPDGGCPSDLPASCPAPSPSYQADVAPIVAAICLACHGPGGSQAGKHDLSTYDRIFAQRTSVLTQVYNCRMPPAGIDPLTAAQRQAVLAWLVCGAPNN